MIEIDEDLESGYWSLPIIFAKRKGIDIKNKQKRREALDYSKAHALKRLDSADVAIPKEWYNMHDKISRLKSFVKEL